MATWTVPCSAAATLASWALWVLTLQRGSDPSAALLGFAFSLGATLKVLSWRPWTGARARSVQAAGALPLALSCAWVLALKDPALSPLSPIATAAALGLASAIVLAAAAPVARATAGPTPPLSWAFGLLGALAFYALLPSLRQAVLARFGDDPSHSLHLFFMARKNYEGIPGAPFTQWARLASPLLWGLGLLGLGAWAWARPSAKRLWALAAYGVLGKLALGVLASSGWQVFPHKIRAVSTAYYAIAAQIDGWVGMPDFIRYYNLIQATLGTHGNSHPFGPELFYWALWRLHPSPWLPALSLMLLTGLTPVLLAALARELGYSSRAGLAAALVYLSAPPAIILSTSGIDSLFSLTLLSALCCGLRAWRQARWPWVLACGTLLFLASLLSLAAAYGLALGALSILALGLRHGREGLLRALKLGAQVGALLLGLHALLWAASGGLFSYWDVYQAAQPYQWFQGARPLYLWSWLNPALYLGYAGAGTLALVFAAAAAWLHESQRPALALAVPAALLVAASVQGLGLGECQRIFHWGYAGLALAALPGPPGGWESPRGLSWLAGLVFLNLATATVLMVEVMTYW